MKSAVGIVILGWVVLSPAPARAAQKAMPVRPEAMVTVPFAPLPLAEMDLKGPEYRRLIASARELAQLRDALAALLEKRWARDNAGEVPDQEVLLDMSEALLSYDNNQVRPRVSVAPQWQDLAGKSLDRIRGTQDFQPGREDVQMLFRKRGQAWLAPQLGMLTSKFLAGFHYKGCERAAFEWNDTSFSGGFGLVSARGDRRFQMHQSGEGSTVTIPEFRQWKDHSSGFWPDWWVGPRERLQPWTESFRIRAGERRGWLLKAVLRAAEPPSGLSSHDKEVFAWIEDGRILRGYAIVPGKLPGRGPELLASLERWSATNRSLEADFVLGSEAAATNRLRPQEKWVLKASLPEADSGGFAGEYRTMRERPKPENKAELLREEKTGVVEGTLFRAYRGVYETDGLDGRRTGEVLVGAAAVVPAPKTNLPAVAVEDGLPPAVLFTSAIELSRQVAALDWALREYPLPLAEALRLVRAGRDDRFRYYPIDVQWMMRAVRKQDVNRDVPPAVRPHMHEALAAMLGAKAAGAVVYAERLVDVARATLADRRAESAPAIGLGHPADPDFGPYAGLRLAQCEAGVNALPARGGDGQTGWVALDDWTCHGFIMRCYSFETGPYLPELPIVPGLRPGGAELVRGKPVRIAHPDQSEHLWAWRTKADPVDGGITIPRECLLLTKASEPRERWAGSAGAGVREEALDFFYNNLVTWYGATALRSDAARRVWMAARIDWDGRVWVNDRLVWRPSREHTPDQVAVFPVDLEAGTNRVTVCCSPRPVKDGNCGNFGAHVFKYGERALGSFTVWVAGGVEPRTPEAVTAARAKEESADRKRATERAARGIRGRRGDGTGLYPDAKPPVAWDIERGINIRWKRSLPTDDAEPVLVGQRLFVTTYTGEVACLDAATGAELWRKKLETPGAAAAGDYPPPAVTASYALPSRMWLQAEAPKVKAPPAYARSCLTPVADLPAPDQAGGQAGANRVCVHDPRGVVACFDHAGKQLWAQAVPAQTPRFAEGGYVSARILPPTHPASVGSWLIAAVGEGLMAFDLETGKVAWQRPALDYLGQFAVADLGDAPAGALVLLSSGEVLDAPTGKTLIARCAPLIPDSACEPVVNGRTAYFHACSTAVRFWRDAAGALCSRVLWHTPVDIRKRQHDMNHNNGEQHREQMKYFSRGSYPPTPALMGDLLFEHMGEQMSISHGPQQSMRLHVFDAVAGCAVSQRYALQLNATHPVTATTIAGDLVFCGDEGGPSIGDYPNFPATPVFAIVTAEEQPRRVTRNQPGLATLSPPVFEGDRMYLAGEDQVVCIGRPEAMGDRYSDYELEALRDTLFTLEVGDKPGPANDGKMVRFEPPPDLALGKGVPVVAIESGKNVDQWLFAGPFAVGARADVFAEKGGAGAIRPEEGQAVPYAATNGEQRTATFVPLRGSPELASASGRKMMTTCYLYTVLEAPATGFYQVEYSKSLMRDLDVFLAGRRLAKDSFVELRQGRYPVMVRAAIGTVWGHERLGWSLRLLALTAREAEQGLTPIEPAPLTKLPEGLRAPLAPLLLSGMPPRMLGAWPLAGDALADPYERMTGQTGALISEGTRLAWGGTATEFRPLPPGTLDTVNTKGISDELHFNVEVGGYCQFGCVEHLGFSDRALFGDRVPSAGLFFAVLWNPRSLCLQAQCNPNLRCWLSGQACLPDRTIRLKPGFYPFLVEYRAARIGEKPVVPVTFREVPDPDIEMDRWLARVRRNAEMLRAIVAGGPGGAYAQAALDALDETPGPRQRVR